MDRKISTVFLKHGMYVSKLDRPWKQTPFLIQGFIIEGEVDIRTLVKYCDYVYIDPERGVDAEMYLDKVPGAQTVNQRLSTNEQVETILESGRKLVTYAEINTTLKELPEAKAALEKASDCVARIVEHDLRKGTLDIVKVKEAVDPILNSVIRNSDAFLWLSKMQEHDAYSYEHSVQNCALGIVFGRHLGLNKKELNVLAMGLLLMDIGKIRIPKELLTKSEPLTSDEVVVMRKHVAFTLEILRKIKGMSEHVINIALTHHERYDGSGYPNALVGTQVPAYGRMAAIIDSYDEMITATPNRAAVPEHKALQNIYNLRNKHFQQELVEQFMQCMGVYPTGSLVELSSGAVGAILSQNAEQRMKPKVLMLLDEKKRAYKNRRICNLMSQDEMPLHIAKSLENNTYGVDVRQIGL